VSGHGVGSRLLDRDGGAPRSRARAGVGGDPTGRPRSGASGVEAAERAVERPVIAGVGLKPSCSRGFAERVDLSLATRRRPEPRREGGRVTVLDELGLSEADLAALARDEPERGLREGRRAAPPGGPDREVLPGARSRERAGGQVRCPACGFVQTPTSSSCRRCGNKLREPSRATRVTAVLGERDERDVLTELGLDAADLAESLDRADVAPIQTRVGATGRFDRHARERIRQEREMAESMLEEGKDPDEVARILRRGSAGYPGYGTDPVEIEEALRQAGALSDAEGYGSDDDDRGDLPSLEEGLDGWLAARVGGSA
jgi:uncharacterized membrane protein